MLPSSEMPESLDRAEAALLRVGTRAGDVAWKLLNDETNFRAIAVLKVEAGFEGDEVERLLVWHAARQALPRVPSLPVDKSVRGRLDQDLRELYAMNVSMAAGGCHFGPAAQIAPPPRFPPGPME